MVMYIEDWEQIEIFEFTDSEFRVFDRVTVRKPKAGDPADTFYYLEMYAGLIGEIIRRANRGLNQFEVAFPGKRVGVFRAEELEMVRHDD